MNDKWDSKKTINGATKQSFLSIYSTPPDNHSKSQIILSIIVVIHFLMAKCLYMEREKEYDKDFWKNAFLLSKIAIVNFLLWNSV